MQNVDIKLRLRGAGLPLWKLASILGVSEMTVTRMFRTELPQERKEQILTIIKEYEKGGV